MPSRQWLRKAISNGSCDVYIRSKSVISKRRKVVSAVCMHKDFMVAEQCLNVINMDSTIQPAV